jgi:hypothetical protein
VVVGAATEATVVPLGATTVAVEFPVGTADADEVGTGTVEEIPAHFAYAAFAAWETFTWNSPIPLLCWLTLESGLVLSAGNTVD